MDDFAADTATPPHAEFGVRASRRPSLAWIGLGIVAFIAFEFTAQPALVVLIGCLKFGWDELATARWLKRTDPDRIRGRICGRFYTAWSLWKVSIIGIIFMFIISYITETIKLNAGRPKPGVIGALQNHMMTALAIAGFGFVLSAGVSTVAVISAWRRGVRVWIGPEASLSRKAGLWPPSLIEEVTGGGGNRVASLVHIAMMALLVLALVVFFLAGAYLDLSSSFDLVILILGLLVVPVCWLTTKEFLFDRVAASSPRDCWPPEDFLAGALTADWAAEGKDGTF